MKILIYIIITLMPLGLFAKRNYETAVPSPEELAIIIKYKDMPCTLENFAKAIKEMKFKNPEFAYRVAIKESGLTSRLAKKCNNLFGMRPPHKRTTMIYGSTASGYGKYRSWINSLMDFKIWEQFPKVREKRNRSIMKYAKRLGKDVASKEAYNQFVDWIIENDYAKYLDFRAYNTAGYGNRVAKIKIPESIKIILGTE